MNNTSKFKKVYAIDTNIILDNASNILTISQESENLVIIPETVLDEVDSKKSGFDEINYQAREFARILSNAEVISKSSLGSLFIIEVLVNSCTLYLVTKEKYSSIIDTSPSIVNDRKILEVIKELSTYDEYKDVIFLSLDVMARTRAISMGIDTETMDFGYVDNIDNLEFHYVLEDISKLKEVPIQYSSVEHTDERGKTTYYYRSRNNTFEIIEDKNEKRFPAPPMNLFQKVASNIIYDETPITVLQGLAGSGKNVTAVSAAMRLIDTKNYNKIYYIRKTVISDDKTGELGFLPGTLEEKMKGYNYPMEDTLKALARIKSRNATKEQIEEQVETYKKKYNIEYLYTGHLRGSTLEPSCILLVDECLSENEVLYTEEYGKKTIKEIEDLLLYKDVKVLSRNLETGENTYEYIESLKKEIIPSTEKMYEIETEDGNIIRVTGNHKLYINGEYRKISDCLNEIDLNLLQLEE